MKRVSPHSPDYKYTLPGARKHLKRAIKKAEKLIGAPLHTFQEAYLDVRVWKARIERLEKLEKGK